MSTFETPSELRAAFDELLASTTRHLRLYDHDLSALDIDQPDRQATLRAICLGGGGRRIELLLDTIDTIVRDHPRLMQLVRDFGHVLEIRQADPTLTRPDRAFVLADRHGVLTRADKLALRGTLNLDDAQTAAMLVQEFEAMWQRSQAVVTATTLGL
ncbi:MAG TPA: hypothetical protein VIN38_04985 [Thiobacillus sp.]